MLKLLLLCQFVASPAAWWERYGDPVLNRLVERALEGNLDIRAAAQRVAEARAISGEARSALLPSAGYSGGAQQLRGGFQQGVIRIPRDSGAGGSFVAPFETGLLSSSFDLRWEASLWGPNAKRLSAARAGLLQRTEELEAVRLMVGAEVARAYFEWRGAADQLAVARRHRDAQAELLDLVRQRAQAGLAPELDAERQAAALHTLEAAIPPLELQGVVRANRLAVLLGDREALGLLPDKLPAPVRLPPLEGGVDSALLLGRPDVRAANAAILAATARLKEARADLYPRLMLTGLAGRQSTSFAGVTLGGGNFFSIGPQLVLPVFTGGRIRANIAASDARLEQARTAYEQELLQAFQETEDAIAAYRTGQARLDRLEEAARRARTTLRLSEDLYKAGLGDFLGVLEAEKSVLDLEMAIAGARASAAVQSALLSKALAGAWPR